MSMRMRMDVSDESLVILDYETFICGCIHEIQHVEWALGLQILVIKLLLDCFCSRNIPR